MPARSKRQILLQDLTAEQITRIERRMRPGRFSEPGFTASEVGFLRADESLADVIAGDLQTLKRFGISPDDIADRLEEVTEQASARWVLHGSCDYLDVLVCSRCGSEIGPAASRPSPAGSCFERRSLWQFREANGTVLERWTGPAFADAGPAPVAAVP